MRALVFSEPDRTTAATHVVELEVRRPAAREVVIDVVCAGVNFLDVMARRGDPGYVSSWPFRPGLEVAGTIREMGSEVIGFAVGDRVAAFTGSGGLAEVATAAVEMVARVPDGLDLERAAAAPAALATAVLLLDGAARLTAGEDVLVHSAGGGVGQALVQLAHLRGARRVFGTVSHADRVTAAQRAGYDAVFVRGDGLGERLAEAARPDGVDVILDPQGTALLELDLDLVAPGGRIVLFGNAAGGALEPLPPPGRLFAANASIGAFSISRLAAVAPARVGAALAVALAHLGAGELDVALTVVDGLDETAEVHQELAEARGAGKRIVRLRHQPQTSG